MAWKTLSTDSRPHIQRDFTIKGPGVGAKIGVGWGVNEENCYSWYCRIACYYIKCIANAHGVLCIGQRSNILGSDKKEKRAERENCAEVFQLRDVGSD